MSRELSSTNWAAKSGQSWASIQTIMSDLLGPIGDLLTERTLVPPQSAVLDVGCGTGETTRALALAAGSSCAVVGIDISDAMIDAAHALEADDPTGARFLLADAETYEFEPETFDVVCSRFGVMFFDDARRAFRNLAGSARPGAPLTLIVWRSAEDNPFMTAAERHATDLVPGLTPRAHDAPGQFGFADQAKVSDLLAGAGWNDLAFEAVDVPCTMKHTDLEPFLRNAGPLSRALTDNSEDEKARVIEETIPAFAPFRDGDTLQFDAACWVITGRRSKALVQGGSHG
ncbi:MAG: class I SAM-dependent methyltransferase [Pseudomonadota bacterium]